MKISTITVTGADDSVKISDLVKLQEKYPILEFGILLSQTWRGVNRFPSADWLKELKNTNLKLSAHICGKWVKSILLGNWPVDEFNELFGENLGKAFYRFQQNLGKVFYRFQLNTHGIRHKWEESFFENYNQNRIIFQNDGLHDDLIERGKYYNKYYGGNFHCLFDMSHGAGRLPDVWPKPINAFYCGYSGGLSPENVKEQCLKIEKIDGDAPIWIDAETRLRSEDDRVFDLNKVEKFVEEVMNL